MTALFENEYKAFNLTEWAGELTVRPAKTPSILPASVSRVNAVSRSKGCQDFQILGLVQCVARAYPRHRCRNYHYIRNEIRYGESE